jgi:hypothetical protein
MKNNFSLSLAILISLTACQYKQPKIQKSEGKPTVACYYFPNYHLDKRNKAVFKSDWTEWELIKTAKPRYPGHYQPREPLWGYTDEADPVQMAQKIDAAADHGVGAFIFDWYYYDDGPFLERGLEDGFMRAQNCNKMKFALMWANHNWIDIFPIKIGSDKKVNPPVMYQGKITPETWDKMTDYIIEKYFKHSSYWLIDGAPYFSVYDLSKFMESFGSVDATIDAIKQFRKKTKNAGFSDLHFNLVFWGNPILPGEEVVKDGNKLGTKLGFNSITSYVWIHHTGLKEFPISSYDSIQSRYFRYAQDALTKYDLPYFPNVSVGWDSSPRCDPSAPWGNYGYPYTPIVEGSTPEAFKKALIQAKDFLIKNPSTKGILTLNSWNEWTEGSYLEPDMVNGMKYLEAVREVFANKTINKQIK